MSGKFGTANLPSICAIVTDGTHDSPKLQPSGIPFIKGKHISSGHIDFECCDFISEEDHLKCIKRVEPQIDDVLFANIGSVGDVARVSEEREFSIKNVALFRPDPTKVDPTYFYYLVVSPSFRGVFLNVRSGAAQPFISLESFRSHRFPFNPDKVQQRRIGTILCAYDDLIENNRRRMALLEEAARQLYREWFVRFRFPGHEHTRITNGVPEGWERKAVEHLTNFLNRGIAPHYDDDAEGLVINQKCIRGGRLDLSLARHQSREFKPEGQVQHGDALVNSTGEGTLGRVAQVLAPIDNCTVDTHVTIVRPAPGIGIHYFGQALIEWELRFSTMGRGATNQTELSRGQIGDVRILVPPRSLVQQFEDVAAPCFREVWVLMEQNEKLRAARDLLLPRLMNGDIAV